MDKYEYKVRADEIKELIAKGDYVQAAEIADTIDWRRVKSVMMLCTISDLYKINRRYEDARDMLLLAYERRPGGRTICYSLCELSIKMEEYVQAVEYYKEFVQVAPKDPGRYILQYKLYEAQDVSLEERIQVLEELKKRDYREKWAYELAYLYHRVGLATRCVEECDEMILWFGDGKYVIKAMELKKLHQPLTPEQQEKYDRRFGVPKTDVVSAESSTGMAIEATPVVSDDTKVYEAVSSAKAEEPKEEELDIQVKTMDVGEYNTINLQAELAAGLREVLGEETIRDSITRSILAPMLESDTESLDLPQIEEVNEDDLESDAEEMESSEVFFGETGEVAIPQEEVLVEELLAEEEAPTADETAEIVMQQMRLENTGEIRPVVWNEEPPKELAGVLSQESDGQISLVMPEKESVEKQITGQMSIEDILAEWERMKKENEEKRAEEVRQHVLQQTGTMFTEFEAAVRDGLLEQLEKEPLEEEPEEEPVEESVEEEAIEDTVEEEPVDESVAEAAEDVVEEAEVEAVEEPAEEVAEEVTEDVTPEEVTPEETIVEQPEETTETEEIVWDVEEEVAQEELQEGPTDEEEISEEDSVEEIAEEVFEEEETDEPVTEEPLREKQKIRALTREERELYAPFVQSRSAREQLVQAVDNISLAAYTGNIIITGEEGMDTLTLAKNMIRQVQLEDSNFSGKVAKITGGALNGRDVATIIKDLKNGALIIQKASGMKAGTVNDLYRSLQQENSGVIVVLIDTKRAMNSFLNANEELSECFTARMDMEALSDDTLVAFGRQYAREMEYSIDEMGVLALHTRIAERQTSDHIVTVVEVKQIVDDAIRHANRKNLGHFFDVLLAKRYDEEDMIILGEKDFA